MVSFRRRIKIAPGVNLNLSKSGISTSIGVKGASMTFGSKGVYANTGIPGTGVYKRTKIAGTSTKNEDRQLSEALADMDDITPEDLAQARALLDRLRSRLEELDLHGRNIVIASYTFDPYLLGSINNILDSMGIIPKRNISSSTDCVLIGDKKELSKYLLERIDECALDGQQIEIIPICIPEPSDAQKFVNSLNDAMSQGLRYIMIIPLALIVFVQLVINHWVWAIIFGLLLLWLILGTRKSRPIFILRRAFDKIPDDAVIQFFGFKTQEPDAPIEKKTSFEHLRRLVRSKTKYQLISHDPEYKQISGYILKNPDIKLFWWRPDHEEKPFFDDSLLD